MSALDNAKAALTTMERLAQDDWCLCVQNGAANEVEESLRVLIAEHERLLAEQTASDVDAAYRDGFCDGWTSGRMRKDVAAATHSPDFRAKAPRRSERVEPEWEYGHRDLTGTDWPAPDREDAERWVDGVGGLVIRRIAPGLAGPWEVCDE